MKLEEMLRQFGDYWSILLLYGRIRVQGRKLEGAGSTIDEAIVAALNARAEKESSLYPWVSSLTVADTRDDGWQWKAVDGGGKSARVAFGDTIADACEAVKPKPKAVTLGVIGEHPAAATTTKVYVNGKLVVDFDVVEGRIELKTEESK